MRTTQDRGKTSIRAKRDKFANIFSGGGWFKRDDDVGILYFYNVIMSSVLVAFLPRQALLVVRSAAWIFTSDILYNTTPTDT